MIYYRRPPLQGLCNARDLGGYATPNGITKYGTFIRSEVPVVLTDKDLDVISKYGIKLNIDLRSEEEQEKVPDCLKEINQIKYLSIPMYDEIAANCSSIDYNGNADCFWAEHYIRMIETQKNWFCSVITELAKAKNCTLYHCATGKDRTGLITMALLGLCDVSDEDIIADYSISEIYLHPLAESFCESDKPYDDNPFYSTSPNNMRLLLRYINETYGTVKGYLFECGLTKSIAEQIYKRFVENL